MILPTPGRVILQLVKEEEPTKGNLILTLNKPLQARYVIIDICPSVTGVTRGLIVYVDKYKGVDIEKNGQAYVSVEASDIVAYEYPDVDVPNE